MPKIKIAFKLHLVLALLNFVGLANAKEPLLFISLPKSVNSLTVAENKIVCGDIYGTIRVWDLTSGNLLSTLSDGDRGFEGIAVANGKIVSKSDIVIKIWDLASGNRLQTISGKEKFEAFAVSDGKIAAAERLMQGIKIIGNRIRVWDSGSGNLLHTLPDLSSTTNSITIADGKLFAGSSDSKITIWDLGSGNRLHTLTGHSDDVWSIAVANGKIISGSSDNTIKIWDLASGNLLHTLSDPGRVWSIAVADGKIVSRSSDNTIKIWDLASGNLLRTFSGHSGKISCIAVADGKIVSLSNDDETIRVWDMKEAIIIGQREAKAKADAEQRQAKADAETKQRQAKIEAEAKQKQQKTEAEGRQQLEKVLAADEPQAMYLAAVKYETDGDSGRAQKVYSAIMERFPQDALAIKAADRLLSIKNAGHSRSSAAQVTQKSSKYWDCSVSVYGADIYGIRKSIFGGGTVKGKVSLEVQADSRSSAEKEAFFRKITYKGVEVCELGGIENSKCKYWKENVTPECSAQ